MAGMEACMVNLLEPGDAALCCVAGFFGGRMAEVARRTGAKVTVLERPWGQVFPLDEIRDALKRERPKVLAIVQAETSTGAWQPLEGLGDLCRETDTLLLVGVYDETDTRANADVSDYMTSTIQDPISRVEGVGDVNIFGAPHAMRIWLNPQRLAAVQLMPSDVIAAITAQNSEVAAGEVGGLPSPEGQMLNATVTAQSRLQTVEQFENIVLKTLPDGSSVRIKDIARVEIGDAPKANREPLFEHLLRLNATTLVHAAYGLDGDRIVLAAALEMENLDYNELEALLAEFDLALGQQLPKISELAGHKRSA
jgi:hypothetical protein